MLTAAFRGGAVVVEVKGGIKSCVLTEKKQRTVGQ